MITTDPIKCFAACSIWQGEPDDPHDGSVCDVDLPAGGFTNSRISLLRWRLPDWLMQSHEIVAAYVDIYIRSIYGTPNQRSSRMLTRTWTEQADWLRWDGTAPNTWGLPGGQDEVDFTISNRVRFWQPTKVGWYRSPDHKLLVRDHLRVGNRTFELRLASEVDNAGTTFDSDEGANPPRLTILCKEPVSGTIRDRDPRARSLPVVYDPPAPDNQTGVTGKLEFARSALGVLEAPEK